MTNCGCSPPPIETENQRQILWTALLLNFGMFVVEVAAGTVARSSGLIADGLDMLSDATVYAIALAAIGRSQGFKANAALISGVSLLLLGTGVILDAVRRMLVGEAPEADWMIAVSFVALVVNIVVLRLLSNQRNGEVHLRAAWIFTRADVVANAAVILAGFAVLLTGIRYFDHAVGAAIGAYVVREAFEIISQARAAKTPALE